MSVCAFPENDACQTNLLIIFGKWSLIILAYSLVVWALNIQFGKQWAFCIMLYHIVSGYVFWHDILIYYVYCLPSILVTNPLWSLLNKWILWSWLFMSCSYIMYFYLVQGAKVKYKCNVAGGVFCGTTRSWVLNVEQSTTSQHNLLFVQTAKLFVK